MLTCLSVLLVWQGTAIFLTGVGLLLLSAWGVYRAKHRTKQHRGASTADSR